MTHNQMASVLDLIKAEAWNPTGFDDKISIRYTNWRGETSDRVIQPLRLVFRSTEWHPEHQWILEATDVEKGAERSFAVENIHSWLTVVTTHKNLGDAAKADGLAEGGA